MTAKQAYNIKNVITAVVLVFSIGSWVGALQYKSNDQDERIDKQEKRIDKAEQEAREIKELFIKSTQQTNNTLTKLSANIIVMGNAQGIKLPFDNSRNSGIANDATIN